MPIDGLAQRSHEGDRGGHDHHGAEWTFGLLLWLIPALIEEWRDPAYAPTPVEGPTYVERATDEDVQRKPYLTYYCPGRGYYPVVQTCGDDWMHVIHMPPVPRD